MYGIIPDNDLLIIRQIHADIRRQHGISDEALQARRAPRRRRRWINRQRREP